MVGTVHLAVAVTAALAQRQRGQEAEISKVGQCFRAQRQLRMIQARMALLAQQRRALGKHGVMV